MCRYANPYKPHFACFDCRKTFKRRLLQDIEGSKRDILKAKCPQCGNLMADMGLDFESPKQKDIKTWRHIQNLYKVGIMFHSCGCSGPGYIPRTTEKLLEQLEKNRETYIEHLRFWINRIEPKGKKEIENEYRESYKYSGFLPREMLDNKRGIKNQDAINYWNKKLQDLENHIEEIRNQ